MKRSGVLNAEIMKVVAEMGHTDQVTIADAGLPIPQNVQRIDMALVDNLPSFIDVLKAVSAELALEKVYIAEELAGRNPKVYAELCEVLAGIECEVVPHTRLKEMSASSRAVVRSGECSPFANVILQSGVTFA